MRGKGKDNGSDDMLGDQEDGPDYSVTSEYLRDMVEKAVRMEADRYDSLQKMSGTLLTGTSIVSVAMLTVAGPLFEFFDGTGLVGLLLGVYVGSLGALLVSILLALVSQLRFGYQALPSPLQLRQDIDDGVPFSGIDASRGLVYPAQQVYEGYQRRNETIRRLLNASAISSFVAFGVMAIGAAILVPCSFAMVL